jgi:DNA-binding response OmpR family regulator
MISLPLDAFALGLAGAAAIVAAFTFEGNSPLQGWVVAFLGTSALVLAMFSNTMSPLDLATAFGAVLFGGIAGAGWNPRSKQTLLAVGLIFLVVARKRGYMKPGTRVLVVEDDDYTASLLKLQLEHRDFDVRCEYDGPSGLKAAARFDPEVVILDIMLPGLDGVGVLKELRHKGNRVPVIMLTARDTPLDKVYSLDTGADDYLTKPFSMEELLARIRALLRRVEGDEVLKVGDLEVNTATREVKRGQRKVDLTPREYELLEFMARNPRRVLSRDLLLSRVWGQESGVETNVVDVYITYLRRKLEALGESKLIQTVRGTGYALREV